MAVTLVDSGNSQRGWQRRDNPTMRVELIGHFKPCMTDIYLHIWCAHGRLYPHAPVHVGGLDGASHLCFRRESEDQVDNRSEDVLLLQDRDDAEEHHQQRDLLR